MAICFDMQIGFLDTEFDREKFQQCLNARVTPYRDIGFHPLSPAFITTQGPYEAQLSITPQNVGMGVSFDKPGESHNVDDDECLKLSLHMYNFLKDLPYYQIALVGWEIGFLTDFVQRNKQNLITHIDQIEGLVVANDLLINVAEAEAWQYFDKDHKWVPCETAIGNIFSDD